MPAETAEIPPGSPADPPPKAGGKARLLTLGHLDQRTAAARRARELIEAIEADLGGSAGLSEGSKQLVQRAAVLGTFIESCEAHWLGGAAVDLADYLAAINSQRRVLATIGLERRARNVTPSVAEYVAHLAEEEAGAA
jgi:glutathione S-transferase